MASFKIVEVGSYCVNCAVVSCEGKCIVVDPGQDASTISAAIRAQNLSPVAIVLTHGHFDHVGGVPGLLEEFLGIPVYLHTEDWPMLGHPMNCRPPEYPGAPRPANLKDVLEFPADFPQFGVQIIHTPGHTPGSTCLFFGDVLLSGDTLFAGSCGRTDFPGGSMAAMRASLAKLAKLPKSVDVVPGHGPCTTIGTEVSSNPFFV